MPRKNEHMLSLDGLDISYGGVQAVCGVSLDVASGEIVGLVGESGSGKSSVLRAIAGLLGRSGRVTGGRMLYISAPAWKSKAGEDAASPESPGFWDGVVAQVRDLAVLSPKEHAALRGSEIAYVFQDPTASLDPLFKIGVQFDECLRAHGISGGDGAAMRALEEGLLQEMGFDDPARVLASYPHELSGGMCQRVVLALSIACEPAFLLADEPTSALDVEAQLQVLDLLARIREERGTAMLVVSHNIAAVARIADRIGVMRSGELVELGACEQVLRDPQHPYTRELIAAVPRMDGIGAAID